VGLLIDTDVWVLAERSQAPLNLSRWNAFGEAFMSSLTASELLVGVERASTPQRRARRGAYVENLLSTIPVLPFSLPVARTHARMIAGLAKKITAGAHDALIAATALHHGHALLTRNVSDFRIFAGLEVEAFVP
jgi:tRNA(fMet)-specific endonuclease VapC